MRSSDPVDTPLVSVIMATHNAAETLVAAIDSIRTQTYPHWELVICDDASSDETSELLTTLAEELGSRLTVVRNATNMKLAYSLNRCLAQASGSLIARMDADDISEANRFAVQVAYLHAHPTVDLVGTAMQRFNDGGLGEVVYPASPTPDRWTLGRGLSVPFFHATIMARATVFSAVNNYTASWRTERGQDVDLWFKFFAAGLIGHNLPDPLYLVREDDAAIGRRTVRARLGGYVTRIQGYRALGYSPAPYLRSTIALGKALLPQQAFRLHRKISARRWQRKMDGVGRGGGR